MATTNPVPQVLVTKGNQDILDAGLGVGSLLPGQMGVFNYHTNLSLSEASIVGDTRDIYLAVGLDKTGSGVLEDINKSAGQLIQVRNAKAYTIKAYVAAIEKVVQITGFKAKCETDYGVKIEFRSQRSYRLNGYNQFAKTYVYHTGCCDDGCTSCGDGDCNELSKGLVDTINTDDDKLVTAALFVNTITGTITGAGPTSDANTTVTVGTTQYIVAVLDADTAAQTAVKITAAINTQTDSPYYATVVGAVITIHAKATVTGDTAAFATSGAGVTSTSALTTLVVTDIVAFKALYPGVCTGIRITTNPEAIKTFSTVNVDYFNPRGTDIIVTLLGQDGFQCNGTATTVTDLQYAEGKGYDIEALEYYAGGVNGKPGPYRISPSTGLAREGFEYYADRAVNYTQLVLEYDQFSVGGWLEYLNNLRTVVAIPCGDSVTLLALVAILDAIFLQFAPMAGDAAGIDCTNVATHTINNPATDGIEALS